MNTLKFKPPLNADCDRKPILIAHRGAMHEAPENTLPAFQRAIKLGTGGIEFDVLLTSDKVPVVTHYDDLSVLTHYHGYAHATPFATIKSLDVGSHFNASSAGITMPTLAETLDLLKNHEIMTIVEIKAQPGLRSNAAKLVGKIVSDFKMLGQVMISSASPVIIHELKKYHPKIPRAVVMHKKVFSFFWLDIFARYEGIVSVHPSLAALSSPFVSRMHGKGRQVFAWTANTPAELDMCIAARTDGIITNDIAFAKRHLAEKIYGE